MKITNVSLAAFRGVSSKLEIAFGGLDKNLLVFGENGSAKSSFARALEHLFNPKAFPEQDILVHRNLFVTGAPEIRVSFSGTKAGAQYSDTVTWTPASGKPTPSWLLSSAARSAFLDHRKLLMLSDRTHGNLAQRFFLTAVQYLFGNLSAGTTGETVASLWRQIQSNVQSYRAATGTSSALSPALTGVAASVAHHKPIEDGVNLLNQALDDHLTPLGSAASALVTETERLLQRFEGHGLTLALRFEHLTFNRTDGTLGGGEITPEVTYCNKALGGMSGTTWVSSHHEVLNEARLTALALSLFFAALRLQDRPHYIAGADPDAPARLLVLDDVLIGLDYDHRIPAMELIEAEFAAANRFQVILLTHDRVWFDQCRLELDPASWNSIELYSNRGSGPGNSDFPIKKESALDHADRAEEFRKAREYPAAGNYARTSIETSLKRICDKRKSHIPFSLHPERHKLDVFIDAAFREPRVAGVTVKVGTHMLLPQRLKRSIQAVRTTVLNPLTHGNPSTITDTQVKRAICVAKELSVIAALA